MTITKGAGRTTGLLAASLLVASGLAGCGSGETTAACTKVQAATAEITSKGVSLISNPKALKAAYDESAMKIRAAAKGTDIADESEQVAVAMEKLGKQVSDLASNPGATLPQLDTSAMNNAGLALHQACS
jgi:hypothetical protein